jgi:two-component system OmpR family response regulator
MQPHDSARILAVDDVADDAAAMVILLELDGYEVRTAEDGVQALNVTAEFNPHCVLLDIAMPRMDGFALAKILRERFGDDIVLIAVTGKAKAEARVSETFDRVDHYLQKPLDAAQLRKVLPPP